MATKIKKLSKVKHKNFVSKLNKWVESNRNFSKSSVSSFYIIDSIYGEMEISSVSINIDMYGYEVFCRFLGENSRKWNHSISDTNMSVQDAIENITKSIESVLIKDIG